VDARDGQDHCPELTCPVSSDHSSLENGARLKSRITPLVYAQRSIAALTNSVP
jgi:hypothetical protein